MRSSVYSFLDNLQLADNSRLEGTVLNSVREDNLLVAEIAVGSANTIHSFLHKHLIDNFAYFEDDNLDLSSMAFGYSSRVGQMQLLGV